MPRSNPLAEDGTREEESPEKAGVRRKSRGKSLLVLGLGGKGSERKAQVEPKILPLRARRSGKRLDRIARPKRIIHEPPYPLSTLRHASSNALDARPDCLFPRPHLQKFTVSSLAPRLVARHLLFGTRLRRASLTKFDQITGEPRSPSPQLEPSQGCPKCVPCATQPCTPVLSHVQIIYSTCSPHKLTMITSHCRDFPPSAPLLARYTRRRHGRHPPPSPPAHSHLRNLAP